MDRGLVVFDDSDVHRQLLREAAEHAAGADASLLLLVLVDEGELEEDVEILSSIGEVEQTHYDADTVLSAIADDLADAASDVLEDYAVDFHSMAVAGGDESEIIMETGRTHDCDHIFLLGRRRSPTQKVVFGDVAQTVVLNYDGFVTLATS